MLKYIEDIWNQTNIKYPNEKQFLMVVKELLDSIEPLYIKKPELIEKHILEDLIEPDRIISFDVKWINDKGENQINKGYRVQFNNKLGPYKGGLRFNKNVSVDLFKSLAFEQTFKNALTGLDLGGGKGGSDFDPHDKSEAEIKRFCEAFIKELMPYIGSDIDVPAGDLGVGKKEITYMLHEFKKYSDDIGALTGKPIEEGGLQGRVEATGYGLCYFTEALLKDHNDSFIGKRVIISGSGNVATYACKKASELGAIVVGMSDHNGYIYKEDGIDYSKILAIKENRKSISEYDGAVYCDNPKGLWNIACDIALPCATQNEISLEDAKKLVCNGCKVVCEGANMPSTPDSINYFLENHILFGPAKAANAGGVSCSGFEMRQNKEKTSYSFEYVDGLLKDTMTNIYKNISSTAKEYGYEDNLVVGANIYSFLRIAK